LENKKSFKWGKDKGTVQREKLTPVVGSAHGLLSRIEER
jgi:hypothetical protein